ncbi:SpaA isopeptide-forming pilin-related protein [Sporofaciens musculi]|uniref:SpaA isopeptide-forming pilin-related protein n=1 Tax=Sporofaciens musculi TaxID=2681861 RepID=UPI001FCC8FBF|nr:SpaA isopeptide-forming pilin-related protein [Sporofaciens musculi]
MMAVMKLHKEESEGQNILKGNVKRIVSGLLSAATVLSAFLQPVGAYAAGSEPAAYEAEYPALEKVKEKLDADEIVAAGDHTVEIDSGFDVENDFSGIEFSPDKVKITFHEAKDKGGEKFDIGKAGTYKAVYFVEPSSKSPSYHVSRNIIVKEKASVSSSEKPMADGEGSGNSYSDNSEDSTEDGEENLPGQTADMEEISKKSMTEAEMEAVIEGMEQAEDTRQDAEMIAEEEGILLFAENRQMARTSGSATMVKGRDIYYPGNLGNYSTCYFTVNGKIAYCLESAKGTPNTGNYAAQIIDGNPNLQKALYYGYGGTGDVTASYMPSFGEDLKYVFTHIAASYFYCGMDGFAGCTMDDLRECGVLGWINYLESLPAPPDPQISLSKTSLKSTYDGKEQMTETTKLNGDSRNSIMIKLPKDVTFHNKTDGSKQTGGNVRVPGGTSFYFTAPVTVNGDWNTGAMKGSIRVIWKALVVPTGSSTQDIGSYYEEESGNSVSLSVDWLERARVKVVKVDSIANAKLSGAVFGVYRDKGCTDLITRMPATDSNGASEVEIVMTQDTVYLKEITAPAGYRYNATAYRVALEANKTTSTTVPDVEQLGNLTVYKEGEVLVGADSNENGTAFRYESRRQKGAVFNVYAAKDITTPYGSVVYKAGELVAENLTTGDNGSVTLKNLHLGTYRVKEMQAPKNFYNKGETKDVAISYAGQMAEAAFSDTTFLNDRQKADVRVVKKDKDTGNGLAGGIFGLYATENITNADGNVVVSKGALISKVTTDGDGNAAFSADLPVGFGYEVREIQAPEGYLRNTEDVYSFRFGYTNDREAKVTFSHIFANERVNATIRLQKKDKETNVNVPQGDAMLEHAVYGLYARNDILHPDKKTGVLYKAEEQVGTLTTDKEGKAEITDLYLGEYFVKEITPPTGYLTDETEYDLVCNYEGDLVATVERDCTSPEQVKKQPFQIIKAADNGKTDADLLSGAGFTAWLVSSLDKKENGGYDFDSAEPVVIGENGATEIFTDERGYACSISLPFGTYIVKETTTPHNYTPVKDFLVHVTEHKPATPQVWRVLLDDEFEAKLKIVKQDDETKKAVLAENTEFKVYDLGNEKYVEQVTTYPTVVTHKSYFTDSEGYLILPQNLKIGHYRIEEVNAPFGYTLNENYYEVSVDSDTLYQMDNVSGDVIIDIVYENHPVKGELHIVKKGEVLNRYDDKDFRYETENLEGAEFNVYAAEDIYTADFQKDENGNRILEYASGALVETLVTDKDGKASIENLPLGTYRAEETKAPEGFVLNGEAQTITFAYADQNTPIIEQTATFENDRQKVEIAVVKKDAENGATVEGAVFGLYAKADILAHGEVIVKADTLLGEAMTEENGKAVFNLDLPFGEYYIREEQAPAGYVSSDETIEVSAAYQGQDVKVAEYVSEFENEPTVVSVKKTDLATGVELEGATLTVLDKDGNTVDTWKSVKGEEHIIKRLTVGETYTLREELAPYGYLKAEEITFTVGDTAEIQKVEMKDDVPTGTLLINKEGEFLEDVSLLDSIGGWITHLFEYVTGSLKDVAFEVYALEDIKATDGESDDYYKKDELVDTIITDDTGIAKLENLPLGKYYVKEKETAEGYVLDGEIREIDLTYRDQDTAVVTFSTDWQNNRQKAEVNVMKTEKDSDRAVEGTVFALCAKEDITNKDGEVIIEAGTVIEEKATDKDGNLSFAADLPIGFPYYVKETAPAPGFTSEGEIQEFDFTYEDAEKESVSYEFAFENVPTVFEFTKTSLTDGKEVEGAKLQVMDEDGNLVNEWVPGKEPHIIKELVVGKKYTMTETQPADGYVTAESIEFTVENTGEVQKVEMKDDVTKVEISKTDIAGKVLPGAKLTILDKDGKTVESWTSENKPHYMEMLPIGKYTLHEESAPDGYLVAEDVKFEIKDTGEIQKVVMKDEAKPDEPDQTKETPKPETPSAGTPKTGDDRPLWLWLALAGIAACGIASSVIIFRRKGKED